MSEEIAVRHVTRLGTDMCSSCSAVQTQSRSGFSDDGTTQSIETNNMIRQVSIKVLIQ